MFQLKSILLAMTLFMAVDTAWGKVVCKLIGTSSEAGQPAGVPVMLNTEGAQIDELMISLELPQELDYLGTTLSDAAESSGVTMKDETKGFIAIALKGAQSGIPEGMLANVVLVIKPNAVPGTTWKLAPQVTGKSAKGDRITIEVVAAEIKVAEDPPQD